MWTQTPDIITIELNTADCKGAEPMNLRLASVLLLSVSFPRLPDSSGSRKFARHRAVSHRDPLYTSDQFSNTVSVIDPADDELLGVLRLGDPTPGDLSPLYKGQLLVHGMGFSPDHRTLAVIYIGSNSVTFIEHGNKRDQACRLCRPFAA